MNVMFIAHFYIGKNSIAAAAESCRVGSEEQHLSGSARMDLRTPCFWRPEIHPPKGTVGRMRNWNREGCNPILVIGQTCEGIV